MSAVVMVAVALLTLWWGGWPFALLWIAAGFVAGMEWSRIARSDAPEPAHLAYGAAASAVGLVVAFGYPGSRSPSSSPARPPPCWGRPKTAGSSPPASSTPAPSRPAPIIVREHPTAGAAMVAWCFAVVWSTDIAAYFTGRKFGGPKLWPAVSPKKTWSGAIGGALAGVIAGLVVMQLARAAGSVWPLGFVATAFWALVCSAAGQLGDLAESP